MRARKSTLWICCAILVVLPAYLLAGEAQNAFNEGVKRWSYFIRKVYETDRT